jgi:GAF domain-containing protein
VQFGTTVKIVAVSHLPDHFVGMIMELGYSVVGQVIKTKAPLVMSDYRNWSDRLRQFDQYGFTAVISAPIIWQDKIWGAIAVHDDVEGKTFNQENLKLLSHLGNLAAVALGNAELVTRESEQKDHFVRLIASSPNAVIALDQLGNITSFNEQAQKNSQISARRRASQVSRFSLR